jgi:nitroimidazol reductase NimA-like FMN-containing flavoprotein (pyridoxamine 5'-phosphate oxidase superfamily)
MTSHSRVPPRSGRLAPIAEEECWQLLETTTVGRLAFTADTGIEILPLNFVVFEGRIYFRTEPGSPIAALAEERGVVAFEVDYHDDMNQSGWSVLVKGSTVEATADDAQRALASTRRLGPWAPGDRSLVIVLSPRTISGRKVSMH